MTNPPQQRCKVEGCETEKILPASGLCHKHHKRWSRYGDPLATTRPHWDENQQLKEEGKKRCAACNRVKRLGLYYTRKGQVDPLCKACRKKGSNGKPSQREAHLRNKYGIGVEEYDRLLPHNNGGCWICGGGSLKALSVDHNHDNGNVRGLLCMPCNSILGRWKDDPTIAERAAAYLRDDGETAARLMKGEA